MNARRGAAGPGDKPVSDPSALPEGGAEESTPKNQNAKRRTRTRRPATEASRLASLTRAGGESEPAPDSGYAAFPVVGVGASAGGLEASNELLRALPTDTGMAFVFVHHLSREHESVLVEIFARATSMPVVFADDRMRVEPNHVYVIPPNVSLSMYHGALCLAPNTESIGARTAVDYFLRSLAEDRGSGAIAVILSGTGADGTLGARTIKAQNGIVMAQEPESAAYDGMPRSAIGTGLVDIVSTPSGIAQELVRIAHHPFLRSPEQVLSAGSETPQRDEEQLNTIFRILRESVGVDFTYYKPTTVRRRIGRRMVVNRIESLGAYMKYLQKNPPEVEELYQDLLINVTGFFREPESFEALARFVFPRLLEARSAFDAIRIWVPACSTGEEAYSLAMALTEFIESKNSKIPIQIFATDVSEPSIQIARAAVYPENISVDVSADRLARFFVHTQVGFEVQKSIRDLCVFAKHDVTRDPPFSRLDIISCRNLLIYLDSVLQRRLIPVFHYALRPTGFLLLGSSETIGDQSDLFNLLDQKYKIYSKRPTASRPPIELGFRQYPVNSPAPKNPVSPSATPMPLEPVAIGIQREADRLTLEKFAPPGVLVSQSMDILQFRGDTTAFLQHAPGAASLNVLEMARPGLAPTLRAYLNKAKEEGLTVVADAVRVKQDGGYCEIDLEIVPVSFREDRAYFLVFFRPRAHPITAAEEKHRKPTPTQTVEAEQGRRDLERTREQLRLTVEEKDASVEELRAANEEIQSSNEELQSINEELETAKEELQSTNEELTTLNEELQNRNFELLHTNDDLRNVLTSVNIPIIILGKDMRIRSYTPMAEKVLNLIPTDIGRPINDLKLKVDVPDLPDVIADVLGTLSTFEREVRDQHGRWFSLHVRPYRTVEDKIDGVVISLLDIDELKRSAHRAQSWGEEFEDVEQLAVEIGDLVPHAFVVVGPDLKIELANEAFRKALGLRERKLRGASVLRVGDHRLDVPEIREMLDSVAQGSASEVTEVDLAPKGSRGQVKHLSITAKRIERTRGEASVLMVVGEA